MQRWMHPAGTAAALALLLLFPGLAGAQERFSLFVGTDPKVVERMVAMAGLRDNDVVIDLGSGDGRVVMAAARLNPTVRGMGVDINPKLVQQSADAAKAAGLADRVLFEHRNAFDTDLSKVDVIFMWFFPELMRLLRVKILEEARPGTRVVANLWDFGTWAPDSIEKNGATVNMWVVPAKVGGYWTWELPVGGERRTYTAMLEQRFQNVEGVMRAGNRHGLLHDMKLRADQINFTLGMTLEGLGYARHEFSGRVDGDRIEGIVRVTLPPKTKEEDEELETVTVPWQARRTTAAPYFAPVGVNLP
jgi:precorrin-6B methylase 2